MSEVFFDQPVLNSPYEYPQRHWELKDGQPTNEIIEKRRPCDLITPVPKPKKQHRGQKSMVFADKAGISSEKQAYNPTYIINELRSHVEEWRKISNPEQWQVTPETARLLKHWRQHDFQNVRPFFCQIEAVETAIWLTEVAPKREAWKKRFWNHIENGNAQANPELLRLALKLATGAGKTTVMAMLIAWQTVNAVRRPNSKRFSRGFLIVTPGITIKDRLRVLLPDDPENYYQHRDLMPLDMRADMRHAKIIITNYHSLQLRERLAVSRGTRSALEGWRGKNLETKESEGQMLRRVMPELMGMKNIVVLNDEAHHCYRAPDQDSEDEVKAEAGLKREEKEEAKENNKAARVWISGLEAIKRKLGISLVYDLSATPFFLRGSGYVEGTLFPWTMSDFSLMDAIECGIVKLPRVPVADDDPGEDLPKFRNLWEHVGKKLSKRGRRASDKSLRSNLPPELISAIEALYSNYQEVFEIWERSNITTPPVFIVVCNNTSTSERVYKYLSGFWREGDDGSRMQEDEGLELFRNYDELGKQLARPKTILIDSMQLESGEALSKDFRQMASNEIDRFRAERLERTGDRRAADNIDDATLLREVMNTVGKEGKLGEQVRCVVSVSMLTEGWDANTVTHILGVRAFGTQLLCEQVVGRALRRQSYELNERGLLDPEHAYIFGVPFDFTIGQPPPPPPPPPPSAVRVHAVRPERDALEIVFPRVESYHRELPEERLEAKFEEDHILPLTPKLVGPSVTRSEDIFGEGIDLRPDRLKNIRPGHILYQLTKYLLYKKFCDSDGKPKMYLFGQLKQITRQWLETRLTCSSGIHPAQVLYPEIKDMAVSRIEMAIRERSGEEPPVRALLDPYDPTGSTVDVNFLTTKKDLWRTDPRKCHINLAVLDQGWEGEFCRVAEGEPRVLSYVKNQNLGLEVPYLLGSEVRRYFPDFIVRLDVGAAEPLNLIVEIKGWRGEDAKDKALTMKNYWIPGVNALGRYGRWDFVEFKDVYKIEDEFRAFIEKILLKEAG